MTRLCGPASHRLRSAGGALLLMAWLADAGASQVYRCTDMDGKVIYSDRPCQTEAPKHAPAASPTASREARMPAIVSYARDARAFQDLQGTWTAAHVTRNGKLHLDRELMGTRWIFRADDLYLESDAPQRKSRHFTVEVEPDARPRAFHVTARSPADRDGWLIFSKERGDLRIAFYQDFVRRPASFDAADGLLVVRLAPYSGPGPVSATDGCGILRAAGAYELIGTRAGRQESGPYRNGGFECRVWREHSVHLLVFPAREGVFESRLKEARRKSPFETAEESGWSARAYSTGADDNVSFVAYKDGNIVQVSFHVRGADPVLLRQVFGRVLGQI